MRSSIRTFSVSEGLKEIILVVAEGEQEYMYTKDQRSLRTIDEIGY